MVNKLKWLTFASISVHRNQVTAIMFVTMSSDPELELPNKECSIPYTDLERPRNKRRAEI